MELKDVVIGGFYVMTEDDEYVFRKGDVVLVIEKYEDDEENINCLNLTNLNVPDDWVTSSSKIRKLGYDDVSLDSFCILEGSNYIYRIFAKLGNGLVRMELPPENEIVLTKNVSEIQVIEPGLFVKARIEK